MSGFSCCSSRNRCRLSLAIGIVSLSFSVGCPSVDPGGGQQYTLTCTVETAGTGQVGISPVKQTYVWGEVVTLTPQAAAGFRFDHWQGDVIGTDNPLVLTIAGNTNIVAVFVSSSNLETKVTSQTRILGNDTTIQTTPEGKILLTGANLPLLNPGNVMVGAGNGSVLARVKSVTQQNGGLLIEQEPASLTDVLERATIDLTPYLKMENAKISRRANKGLFDFDIENGQLVLSINDLEIELGEGAKVTLQNIAFGFGPTIEFNANIDDFQISDMRFVVGGTSSLNVDVELESTVITNKLKKEVKLAEVDFLRGVIYVGVPIEYVCTAELTLGVEAKFGDVGTVAGGFDLSTGINAGVQYSLGNWTPTSSFNFDVNPHVPSINLGPVEVEVYAKPQVGIRFFEVAGPALAVKDYVKLVGNLRGSDGLLGAELRKGSAIELVAELKLLDFYKLSRSFKLWDSEYVMLALLHFGAEPRHLGTVSHSPDGFAGSNFYWYIDPVTVTTSPLLGYDTIGYRVDYLCRDETALRAGATLNQEPIDGSKEITALVVPMDEGNDWEGSGNTSSTGPYTITTEVYPPDAGKVILFPKKTSYKSSDRLLVRGKPEYGFKFHHWEKAMTGTSEVQEFRVPGNATIRAVFESTIPRHLHVPQDYGTIQAALDAATYNDVVHLDEGIFSGNGNRDLDFHKRNVTILGHYNGGTIIDLGGTSTQRHRLATLWDIPGTVYLAQLVIRNGYAGSTSYIGSPNNSGGAVNVGGYTNLDVLFCTFQNCTAPLDGGAICYYTPTMNAKPCLRVSDSRFENCTSADSGGGAICIHTSSNYVPIPDMATITACTFTGNTGGAIECLGLTGSLLINNNCQFIGNTGGAVQVDHVTGEARIENSTFTNNTFPLGVGAAINCGNNTIVSGCTFTGNTAGTLGGAIQAITPNQEQGYVRVENCSFANNAANQAGAVYLQDGTVMSNCTFTGNRSITGDAGGAWIGGHASQCTFTGNSSHHNGGGATVYETGTLDGSTFTGNSASGWGGAIYLNGGVVSSCNVDGNQATGLGAVFSSGGILRNSTITNNHNTERHHGGGVSATNTDISNCTISNNQTTGDGGGVSLKSSTMTGCTVEYNSATENGGGVMAIVSTIVDCIIRYNTAAVGGGVWSNYSGTDIWACDIEGNSIGNCHAENGTDCQGYY